MIEALLPEWRDDWALFLDVDGTLVEIAATPTAVRVPARVIAAIDRARERLHGAVALVSGRSISDLDRLFAPLSLPAAGAHGAERRTAEGVVRSKRDGFKLTPARDLLIRWVTLHPGALLEDKGAALALHYRNVPYLEPLAQRVMAAAVARVGSAFHLQEGKKVIELVGAAASKGTAIEAFMAEPPFHGRKPVFVGDDIPDEDAFAVVNRLGGHSVAVGVNRSTYASWRANDEAQVLRWLESQQGGGR